MLNWSAMEEAVKQVRYQLLYTQQQQLHSIMMLKSQNAKAYHPGEILRCTGMRCVIKLSLGLSLPVPSQI